MNGDSVRALRHAREVAADLRWRGMAVPRVYEDMAGEFQELVRSGAYAAWVAAEGHHTNWRAGHGTAG